MLAALQSTAVLPYLPYIAGAIVVMLLALIIVVTIYAARRRAAKAVAQPTEDEVFSPAERRMALSGIHDATRRLQGLDASRQHPYSIPWFLLLGDVDAKTSRLIDALEVANPADPRSNDFRGKDYRVTFAREGAVVEVESQLLSAPNWSERWGRLLRLLRAARPERPVDGIVIAISLNWLIGPDAAPPDKLADKGSQLYEAIWRLQRETGLRVPIYLAITCAEQLKGFPSLAGALPGNLRDEVFGWATPDGLIEGFNSESVPGALRRVASGIGALHLQIIGSPGLPASFRDQQGTAAGELLLLPAELQALASPLVTLLTAMLRVSAYHEAFLFRGFFLTGSVVAPTQQRHEAFARGLFRQKVFREYQMARPAHGVLNKRNWRVRIAQSVVAVFVAIGCLGLVALGVDAPQNARDLRKSIDLLNTEVQTLQSAQRSDASRLSRSTVDRPRDQATEGAASFDLDRQRRTAETILQSFNEVPATLVFTLAPTSAFLSPDNQVIKAFTVGYELFVLKAIRDGLYARVREILQGIPVGDEALCAAPALDRPTDQGGIDRFQKLINDAQQFNQHRVIYGGDTSNYSVGDITRLARYALNVNLPQNFSQDGNLYQKALGSARKPELDRIYLAKRLTDGIIGSFKAAAAAQFDDGRLAQAVKAAASISGELSKTSNSGSRVVELLRQLRTQLKLVEDTLAANAPIWGDSAAALGPKLTQSIESLRRDRIDLLSETFPGDLEKLGQDCRRQARTRLLDLARNGGLSVIEQLGDSIVLSARFKALSQTINSLLDEELMSAAPVQLDSRDSGRRLTWDAAQIGAAERAVERYAATMPGLIDAAPLELRAAFRLATQHQLRNFVLGRVAAARRFRPEDTGGLFRGADDAARRSEIRSFAAVGPLVSNLQIGLEQLDLGDTSQQIAQVSVGQAERLLTEVSRRLESETFYQPIDPSFLWWSGEAPISIRAFGAATQADLAAQLSANRNIIAALAENEAQPLVSFLGRSGGGSLQFGGDGDRLEMLARWAGVIDSLSKYERRSPDSTLVGLEQFIMQGMDQVSPMKCREAITAPATSADYFGERLQRLQRGLYERCGTLQRQFLQKQYGQLAAMFNRTLAGRFPFSLGGRVGRGAVWADPDDIRRFFKAVDQVNTENLPEALRSSFGANAASARFFEQIEALRPVLGPLLSDPNPDRAPSWEAEVEFRANPTLDQAGNQVLEWMLESPGQRISSLQKLQPLVWSYGQPIKIAVRWARNAPTIPAADLAGPPVVRDVTATWNYDNPWGLLALLEELSASRDPALPSSARSAETIVLSLPLMANANAASGGESLQQQATLYVRFRLFAIQRSPGQPDKRFAVGLSRFPSIAPPL